MCNFLCCVEEVWWTTDAGKWRTHDCTTSTNTSSTFTPNLMSLRISHVSESLNSCPNLLDIWFTVFIHISTYPLSELLIDQSVITTNDARDTIAIFREKMVFRDPKISPTLMMHKRGSNPQLAIYGRESCHYTTDLSTKMCRLFLCMLPVSIFIPVPSVPWFCLNCIVSTDYCPANRIYRTCISSSRFYVRELNISGGRLTKVYKNRQLIIQYPQDRKGYLLCIHYIYQLVVHLSD